MNQIVIFTLTILILYISSIIIKRIKRTSYIQAGKEWDKIVKDLSERK